MCATAVLIKGCGVMYHPMTNDHISDLLIVPCHSLRDRLMLSPSLGRDLITLTAASNRSFIGRGLAEVAISREAVAACSAGDLDLW